MKTKYLCQLVSVNHPCFSPFLENNMRVIINLHLLLVDDGVPLHEADQVSAPEDPLVPGQLPALLRLAAGAPLGVDQAQVRLARQVGGQVVSVHNGGLGLPVSLSEKHSRKYNLAF